MDVSLARRRPWGAVFLFVLGGLLGAAMASPGPSEAVSYYTRSASCPGAAFVAVNYATENTLDGGVMFTRSFDAQFVCNAALPDDAIVTSVQFTTRDVDDLGQAKECGLYRFGLAAGTALTSTQPIASVPATSYGGKPGTVRQTDDSISYATVDNGNYGYWFSCVLDSGNWGVGILGADIIYKITAAKG